MYGIFTYIYHKHQPNVGKYTIHGLFGIYYDTSMMYLDTFSVYDNTHTHIAEISPRGDHNFGSTKMASAPSMPARCNPDFHTTEGNEINNLDHLSHRIHVWYIYLHLFDFFMGNVGKYTINGSYGYGNLLPFRLPYMVLDTGSQTNHLLFEHFEKYKAVKGLRPFGDLFYGIDFFDGISQ